MGRSYSDPSYGSKKEITLEPTGALNGTDASFTEIATLRHTFMQPVKVSDMQAFFVAGGTTTTKQVAIGKSAGGTGAITQIGTFASYTQAINTILDGAVTETAFSTGDDLTVSELGTSTTVENMRITVQYKEAFEADDS